VRKLLSGTEVRAEPVASNELARLADAVARAEAELDAFMLDLGNRERYGARFETYLDARLRALEDAEAAYGAAAARLPTTALAPLSWDDLDADELHAVVAGAIDAVFVRRPPRRGADVTDRACIVWRGQAEDDLPGKGRAVGPIRSFDWPTESEAVAREVPA
jgi:hypothetical protein